MDPNLSFWQWLISDWHWFYAALAIWVLWEVFVEDMVEGFLKNRRKTKELELELELERERNKRLND